MTLAKSKDQCKPSPIRHAKRRGGVKLRERRQRLLTKRLNQERMIVMRIRNARAFDYLSNVLRQYKTAFSEKQLLEEKLSLSNKSSMTKLIRTDLVGYDKLLKSLNRQKCYYYDYLQQNR